VSTPQSATPESSTPLTPPRRSRWRHVFRICAGVAILLAVSVAVLAWYANSAGFQDRVRRQVIATVEQATGGRVELKSFRWRLLHLEFEASDFTIHGLEGTGEIPYAHLDRLRVHAKILSFVGAKVGLSLLSADHPVFHLIIYPDGSTNQPIPKTVRNGKPLGDTLFDLAIGRVEVVDGLAIINERKIPFDFSANNLAATITYQSPVLGKEHYLANVRVSDLTAHRRKQPAVHSTIDLSLLLGRNDAELKSLHLKTGPSLLEASGAVENFANPRWNFAASGKMDIREIEALTEIDGLRGGIADIRLKANGEGTASFLAEGDTRIEGGDYRSEYVTLQGVSATSKIRATHDQLLITGANAKLQHGGTVQGELRLDNWLAPTPPVIVQKLGVKAAKVVQSTGSIRAKIAGITLRSVLAATAIRRYQDIGFDTGASGPVTVDWAGLGQDLKLDAKLSLAPTPGRESGEVPVSGALDAEYFDRRGTVQIRSLEVHTPGTSLRAQGDLGVYPESRTSALQGDLTTNNLAEFDRTLTVLGLVENGKQGVQALPIELHGQAEFHGDMTGTLIEPTVKGHVIITNFDTLLPAATQAAAPKDLQHVTTPPQNAAATSGVRRFEWDRLDATGQYSLAEISIQQATIVRGNTTIHASGAVRPHMITAHQVDFDEQSNINATIAIQEASVADLLAISGEQQIPVSGTLSMNAHASGVLNNLNGGGNVDVKGGEIYGEPYRSIKADLVFSGRELGITKLTLLQNGGQLTADGAYDLGSKNFRANLQGKGFELSHFRKLQNQKMAIGGELVFDARGSGTFENPIVHANAHLTDVMLGDQQLGKLDADAHSENGSLFFTTDSRLAGAQLQISGQTEMHGDFLTQARLTFSEFDIDPLLRLSKIEGLTAHSSIEGQLTLSGPLKEPKRLNGEANISQFAISMSGVPLQSDGPVHAIMKNGTLSLDPLHITGDNTNLRVQGTLNVFGKGDLGLHSEGEVNLKIAQTLNPDVVSSGRMDFTVDARGTMEKPDLTGQVKFTNAAMALQDLPNGLSQMNGTLEFNQDRLDVKSLTAQTGGGQLKIGGYVTYQRGLYGDLTATGKNIRIRYPQGVSSMADATLRLQGSEKNMVLSGNIVLTRFSVNPDLDISGLVGSSTSIAPPTDGNAPSNHVRLDIRITSAPALNFQNSFAKLAGDVDLRLRGTIASPSVLGRVNVTEGSATFAGTRYQLQHGDIYFTNPVRIDPTIDLDAVARVENYDITIGLHGSANKLNVSYRSEPPLPQSDVIALLALGRTQEEQNMVTQQQQNQGTNSTTNALLGGALNATVSNRVQKLFGVGSVKIDPTFVGTLGNSSARVTVEQQVAKNVTLTYATNVNSTAQQLIQADIDITHNVSLVAVRDETGVFSMVVKVHRRYR
jgi:translocation and assembly module TamB